jgi:hypothetical protein
LTIGGVAKSSELTRNARRDYLDHIISPLREINYSHDDNRFPPAAITKKTARVGALCRWGRNEAGGYCTGVGGSNDLEDVDVDELLRLRRSVMASRRRHHGVISQQHPGMRIISKNLEKQYGGLLAGGSAVGRKPWEQAHNQVNTAFKKVMSS